MDPVTDDVEAIRQLKARYFRFLDTKDWANWRMVFAEDFIGKSDTAVSTGGADGRTTPEIRGGQAFVDAIGAAIGACITVHHGHMPEIELISPESARGIWAMEDIVEWPDGRLLRGYGHYHETYRKVDGAWKIASLHLTRTRMDMAGPWTKAG